MKFVRLLNDEGRIYDSYDILIKLVELSGFETIEQNEFSLDADEDFACYILNGNVREWASRKNRKCRLIGIQLERPGAEYADFIPDGLDEVWLCDRWLANEYRGPKVKYVPIGGHPLLGAIPHPEKEWDFAVMSYLHGKREQIVNDLKDKGYTMAPNAWSPEREEIMSRCRMGLCLHQDSAPVIEPLRFTMMACSRLPLVCEFSHDYFPYKTYGLDEIERAKTDADNKSRDNFELLTGWRSFRRGIEEAIA
jgi:hypothetical protein